MASIKYPGNFQEKLKTCKNCLSLIFPVLILRKSLRWIQVRKKGTKKKSFAHHRNFKYLLFTLKFYMNKSC